MYDDDGNSTSEPENARRMFATPKNLLLSIVDDNDNSTVRLYISKSTRLKRNRKMRRLIQTLRTCASKYNMMFKVRRHSKELKPKDFATRASVTEGKEYMTELTEGLYGTSRRSYLAMENARMIIRHKNKINETVAGARSRMIESILIENEHGERFLMPTNQLAPARAMTQHVNQGGSFADEVGSHILRMGQAYQDLGQCSHFIVQNQPALSEGAMPIRERCMGKRKDMRRSFSRIARETTYSDECNVIKEMFAEEPLVEAAVLENLREVLTVEGKELSESVLNTVAAFVGESDDRMIDEDEMRDVAPKAGDLAHETGVRIPTENTTRVLDKYDIPKDVWEKFKRDDIKKLDLRAPPVFNSLPDFKTKTAEIFFKASHIAPLVKDDAMRNMLADIGEQYHRTSDASMRKGYLILAARALQAANVPLSEGLGPRAVDAILEHEAWFAQFDPAKVLMEASADADDAEELEEDCPPDCGDEELSENFLSPFKKSRVETVKTKSGGYTYIIDHLGDVVVSITQRGPDGNREIPITHPLAATLAAKMSLRIEGPINPKFESEEIDDVVLDEEFEDVSEFSDDAFDDDGEVYESEELTKEDVLLPKDPGLDLAREVSAREDDEDEDEDILDEGIDPEIARIIQLSKSFNK